MRNLSHNRTRTKAFAAVACLVLVLGVGGSVFALSTFMPAPPNIEQTPTPSGNFFQMSAFADEGGTVADGPVSLSIKEFNPGNSEMAYTSENEDAAYTYRQYNVDLTCRGDNVVSMKYELDSSDLSFFNWQLKNPDPLAETEIGTSPVNSSNGNSYTVDYHDQDINTADRVNHEICLRYNMNDTQKTLFDEQRHNPFTLEKEVRLQTELSKTDADIISKAKLQLTATYKDGTTATKTYRIAPVSDFEKACTDYFKTRFGVDNSSEIDSASPLFTLGSLRAIGG